VRWLSWNSDATILIAQLTGAGGPAPEGRASRIRRLGGRGTFVASKSGVAEEARTRGFAAPAFAGCAFVERM
jgi:hypothetical protein